VNAAFRLRPRSLQSPVFSLQSKCWGGLTGDSKRSQPAAVGQGSNFAEVAGDRAPGRG
jgi:hypothetical protein